jgi:hypothetical protein
MSRELWSATLGWMAVAALHVAAQQPAAPRTGPAAAVPRATIARATPRVDAPRLLPGTRPNVFTTIQGNALTSTNASLTGANVRLRDARIGQIVDVQTTDKSGLFSFRTVDPGSYIVEIVSPDQSSVLAASQVLNVGPGDAVSAVVKLPFRAPTFAGALGATPSATAVTTQAAASGLLATTTAGAPTCDTVNP